ncbi:carbohydrate kinase [Candidatus Aerophobetes bacterium]|nr:carbohydrate kinase [Candidatus Aerophobetes bacterium]
MAVKYYIGFDCGTLGTKVGIFTSEGETVVQAFREHKMHYPRPGWVEMDAEQFYQVVTEGICECLSKGKVDPQKVAGISCSGIICGQAPLDDNWKPVGPYICFLDGRATKEAEELQRYPNSPWVAEAGNSEPASYQPPVVLKWVQKHRPEVIKKTKKVVAAAPYVIGRLGNFKAKDAYIDWGHMSGWVIGFDARKRIWSERQIQALGLPFEWLPRAVKPWDIVGELSSEEAKKLGLKPGVPLVAGSGDIWQSCLGSGLTGSGMCFDVAGTASIFVITVDDLNPEITGTKMLITAMPTLDDLYAFWGFIPAGGFSLRWFRDEIYMRPGESSAYDELNEMAEKVVPGSDFTFFFPFLQGRGTPLQPQASGTWLGLRGSTKAGHLWRSIMESIAFEYKIWTQFLKEKGVSLNKVIGSGGGTYSQLFNQIKADMLNLEYVLPERGEGAILGNALLVAYAVGDVKDLKQTAKEWVRFKESFKPRENARKFYEKVAVVRNKILDGPLTECFDNLTRLHEVSVPGS